MSETLDDFHQNFFNEVRTDADALGRFMEDAFLEKFAGWLIDCGELETLDIAHYQSSQGMRVDAYGGDPAEAEGVMSLVVADFSPSDVLGTLTRTDAEAMFRRARKFFQSALEPDFRDQLEESSPGYGLAELIHARRAGISRLRIFILSNRSLSSRYEGTEADTLGSLPVSYNVWDIGRLHRLVSSGRGKEDIVIDFDEQFGRVLPCLPAHVGGEDYEAYLVVVPGELLSLIYDRWGARLLEQNVRSFLQARGGVNKGIRTTILNDPGMFFAYNNGVTATAEAVETISRDGATCISRLRNLQIVNGGQTTASIFSAAKRDKADLSRVFVQMKLSIVQPAKAMEVVPRISEYANSQNRVNAADFFANHPFHIRLEEMSRRLWAPAADGSFRQSKWFYERARGSYLDARAHLTPARVKAHEQEYPKAQSFAKTDLAKYEMVWEARPHLVSKGAQHNFTEYARLVGERWDKDKDQINELYFRTVVAKAIIFRSLEKLVSQQAWYDGGYRAQLVAYTIAKFDHMLRAANLTLDFEAVWKAQVLPADLARALIDVAEAVLPVVTRPDPGIANVTEWAKKQACWARVQTVDIELSHLLGDLLIDPSSRKAAKKEAKQVQKLDNGIEAQTRVFELGTNTWKLAGEFASSRKVLGFKEHQLLSRASKPSMILSDKECILLLECLTTLEREGFSAAKT